MTLWCNFVPYITFLLFIKSFIVYENSSYPILTIELWRVPPFFNVFWFCCFTMNGTGIRIIVIIKLSTIYISEKLQLRSVSIWDDHNEDLKQLILVCLNQKGTLWCVSQTFVITMYVFNLVLLWVHLFRVSTFQ